MKQPDLFPSSDEQRPEELLRTRGYRLIAGVDEAGRGPLAGPVVAAAVMLPSDFTLEGLTDSKQLSPSRREALYDCIQKEAIAIGIGMASPEEIDRLNILQAALLAMRRALEELSHTPDFILVDGLYTVPHISQPQQALVKGDLRSPSVAAASILAKVTRDRLMQQLHREYPQYGWDQNKGYPTRTHYEALSRFGPTPYHRRSFRLTARK